MISSPWGSDRVTVLGVNVSAIDMDDCVATIDAWIKARSPHYVCITGVHGVISSVSDDELRRIHNAAGMVTPDGMPLVWMSHWLGYKRTRRVYGPDLMAKVSQLSPARKYRHFYFGGGEGVATKLQRTLQAANPGLEVVGTITPPFRSLTPEEDDAVIAEINAARPDIVWVGLSTPLQERWMASHVGRLNAPVLIGVGAAFDFLSGGKKQAPAWMQRNGLEWLFRLASEPTRLWRRYLTIVPKFIVLAGLQVVQSRLGVAQIDRGSR
ncbi:MAG: WecB/TagA/CpsF family glycosyltransferase [Hyphomicrobium sp.]|jgi:N-acetylglucosaminyldiphosphoundecaprenol N-acetyl-beta-D-mannosaminyltransferase